MKQDNKKNELSTPMKLNDIHNIGKRLKHYREKMGLEQKDIAGQIGFTPGAVSS